MIKMHIAIIFQLFMVVQLVNADRFYYDKVDRLVKVDYDNGCSIAYEYDAFGNILKKTSTGPDTSKPVLIKPDNLVFTLKPGQKAANIQFSVSAIDKIDSDVTVVCSPASGSLLSAGRYIITCKATTTRGTTAVDSFRLTVRPESVETGTAAVIIAKAVTKSVTKSIVRASHTSNTGVQGITSQSVQTSTLTKESHKLAKREFIETDTAVPLAVPPPEMITVFSGLFNAPVDGMYTFTLIGMRGCQLWISPTQYAAAKMLMLESTVIKGDQNDTVFVALELFKDVKQYIEVRGMSGTTVNSYVKGPGLEVKALPGKLVTSEEVAK